MPCFNSEKFIEESILSVLNQTYSNWELLICDDNSSDNSKEIIQHYQNSDQRIRLVTNQYSKGAPGARNSCIDQARGRYIAFLDSDDIWMPDKLRKQLNFLKENNLSFVYSYYKTINENGNEIGLVKSPNKVNINIMLFSNFIGCLTVIYDSKILGKFHQPNIKKRNDFALWIRILCKHKNLKAFCYEEVTASYRVNSYGLSSNKISALKYYRICLLRYGSVGNFRLNLYCICYLIIIFIKKKLPKFYNYLVIKI